MSEAATEVPEWAQSLPAEFHESPYLKDTQSAADYVAQVKDADAQMGNSVRLPGPDAPADSIGEFQAKILAKVPGLMLTPNPDDVDAVASIMHKLGTPENASGYKLPEGVEMKPEAAQAFMETAHSIGLTQAQFAAQMKSVVDAGAQADTERTEQRERNLKGLKDAWGIALDERLGEVRALLNDASYPQKELIEALDAGDLAPSLVQLLYKSAEGLREDATMGDQIDGDTRQVTTEEAKARIRELGQQIAAPNAKEQPRYNAWITERRQLIEKVVGDGDMLTDL